MGIGIKREKLIELELDIPKKKLEHFLIWNSMHAFAQSELQSAAKARSLEAAMRLSKHAQR